MTYQEKIPFTSPTINMIWVNSRFSQNFPSRRKATILKICMWSLLTPTPMTMWKPRKQDPMGNIVMISYLIFPLVVWPICNLNKAPFKSPTFALVKACNLMATHWTPTPWTGLLRLRMKCLVWNWIVNLQITSRLSYLRLSLQKNYQLCQLSWKTSSLCAWNAGIQTSWY